LTPGKKKDDMKPESFGRHFSFRTRLMIALVLMGVFSAGLVAVYGFLHERRQIYEAVEKQHVAMNQACVLRIENLLSQAREDLMLVAMLPRVQELFRARDNGGRDPESGVTVSHCNQRLELFFASMHKTSGRYVQICILVSCQPCNVVNNVVSFLHNQLGRIGYEEIHRDAFRRRTRSSWRTHL
jgi:hypothetical protein